MYAKDVRGLKPLAKQVLTDEDQQRLENLGANGDHMDKSKYGKHTGSVENARGEGGGPVDDGEPARPALREQVVGGGYPSRVGGASLRLPVSPGKTRTPEGGRVRVLLAVVKSDVGLRNSREEQGRSSLP